jgi:hypothetical protein
MQINLHEVNSLGLFDLEITYTLYKNAGFWLINSHDIFLPIQALHCEFAEFLLHVGVLKEAKVKQKINIWKIRILGS